MAITPILADSALDILYQVDGLPHRARMRCNRTAEIGGFWNLAQASGSGILASDAADMVFTLMAPIYKNTKTSFIGYTLFQYSAGAYLPLEGGATALVATGSTDYQKAQSFCFTFRDDEFKKVRFFLFENSAVPLDKFAYAGLSAAYQNIIDSISGETDADIGSWYCGRGDAPVNTLDFLSAVGSLNRRIRRRRGMV